MPQQPSTVTVPPPPAPARRSGLPVLASLAPVGAGLLMWGLTGSVFALWFCALAPVMALASLFDTRRAERRERRRHAAHRRAAAATAREQLARAHDTERAALWAQQPDLAALAADPAQFWRPAPGRDDRVVVGRGGATSEVVLRGDEEVLATLREDAAVVTGAPVTVPVEGGVAVCGPPALADAVARGLQLQVLCRVAPGSVVADGLDPRWAELAPHDIPASRRLRAAPPERPGDIGVLVVPPGTTPPPGCAAVIRVRAPQAATLDHGGRLRDLEVEAVSLTQARALAAALAARAGAGVAAGRLPATAMLADLPDATGGLAVHLGVTAEGPFPLDLVADGPHAVVAGITGSGKSELLTTWVAGMAAGRSPEEVTFVLADFKGGTAFDRLAGLPHVVGVVTDLDERGARRAIESLRAEIRHREAVLAAAGARDAGHPDVPLSRLVIVVDEFAALLQHAPELAAVFTDVAARGRALGMHLILGTQRAGGVVREALLANCPLRLSLRAADAADSAFLLGEDAAARERDRGVAHVRTARRQHPVRVRVALTADADLAALAAGTGAHAPVRVPWLPPLPERVTVEQIGATGAVGPDDVVIGLADRPEEQRQVPLVLGRYDGGLAVVGGPGAGRSGLLRAVAAQAAASAIVVPAGPEPAWDLLMGDPTVPPGGVLVVDDLDVLLSRFPADAAALVAERITVLARVHGLRPVVSTARCTGPVARVVELCGRRAVLRLPTRLEHIAAGADPDLHDPRAPRGRGVVDGMSVQFAEDARPLPSPAADPEEWRPLPGLSAVVLSGAARAGAVRTALERGGAAVGAPGDPEPAAGERRVLLGDVDQWQRAWQTLATARAHGELVIDAGCAAEYRLLTGDRTPPPYCEPGRGRAWLLDGNAPPRRVVLPGTVQAAERRPLR